jgi:hypothetical protein
MGPDPIYSTFNRLFSHGRNKHAHTGFEQRWRFGIGNDFEHPFQTVCSSDFTDQNVIFT